MQRIFSVAIALGYIGLVFAVTGRMDGVLRVSGFLILCLACIWFGDEMGGYLGYAGWGRKITKGTPGSLVRFMGWVLLLLPAVVIITRLLF